LYTPFEISFFPLLFLRFLGLLFSSRVVKSPLRLGFFSGFPPSFPIPRDQKNDSLPFIDACFFQTPFHSPRPSILDFLFVKRLLYSCGSFRGPGPAVRRPKFWSPTVDRGAVGNRERQLPFFFHPLSKCFFISCTYPFNSPSRLTGGSSCPRSQFSALIERRKTENFISTLFFPPCLPSFSFSPCFFPPPLRHLLLRTTY